MSFHRTPSSNVKESFVKASARFAAIRRSGIARSQAVAALTPAAPLTADGSGVPSSRFSRRHYTVPTSPRILIAFALSALLFTLAAFGYSGGLA